MRVLLGVMLLCFVQSRVDGRGIHANRGENMSPTWPAGCNMSIYTDLKPRVQTYWRNITFTNRSQCERACEEEVRCGMFSWDGDPYLYEGGNRCYLYQISARMMAQAIDVPVSEVLRRGRDYITASKDCDAQILPSHCDEYPVTHERVKPKTSYYYTLSIFQESYTHNITVSQCLALCSMYSECESATYYRGSHESSNCALYESTVEKGSAPGYDSYPVWTTYERVCKVRHVCLHGGTCQMNGSTPYCHCGDNTTLAPPYCKMENAPSLSYQYVLVGPGYRIANHTLAAYEQIPGVVACCGLCNVDVSCVAVNYQEIVGRCELVSAYLEEDVEDSEGYAAWHVNYTKC